jgi:hypothetical protein
LRDLGGARASEVYVSDMSVGRVVRDALLCALLIPLACGERAGEPVVTLTNQNQAGASAAGNDSRGGTGQDPSSEQGPTGLCGPCLSSDECGDANDACIRRQDERFCGRDCDEQRGCPDGYSCLQLDNSQLFQCVPLIGCPRAPLPAPPLADIRQYLLGRINAERAARSRQPIAASSCLDVLAQNSAVDFARTDEPLGKYVKECDPILPNCACGWDAEAEVAIAGYALDWITAIERALAGSYRGTLNDRFVVAYLDNNATEVGIGFWLSGDEAWIALSFH